MAEVAELGFGAGGKLTTKGRQALAALSDEDLRETIAAMGDRQIGRNSRNMLSELAIRAGKADPSVAIVRFARDRACIWSIYDPDRLGELQEMPGRRWNGTAFCNTLPLGDPDAIPRILDFMTRNFAAFLMIDDDLVVFMEGKGDNVWQNDLLYDLLDEPAPVPLGAVTGAYAGARSVESIGGIARIVLHGETDIDFRSLFLPGLDIDDAVTVPMTRHRLLLFRFSVSHGQPRYAVYDVVDRLVTEIAFGASRRSSLLISQFKETQRRHAVLIIEAAPVSSST